MTVLCHESNGRPHEKKTFSSTVSKRETTPPVSTPFTQFTEYCTSAKSKATDYTGNVLILKQSAVIGTDRR